jgi:hypothetical protein
MATVLVQLEGQCEHPDQIGSAPATPVRFQALPVGSVHHAGRGRQIRQEAREGREGRLISLRWLDAGLPAAPGWTRSIG